MSDKQKPGKRLAEKQPRRGSRVQTDAAPESASPKKRRTGRTLACVLIALGILALALRIYVRPPSQDLTTNPPPENTPTLPSEHQETTNPGKTQKNAYTCLLIGQRDGMTDTLMVAMLDLDAKTANVVSIPRDTVVDVSRRTPKINGAYSSGGGGEEGVEQLLQEISTLIGYTPGDYAMVNMQAFVDLVDEIGGVEFDVPVRMYKKWEGIDLQPGLQTLNGKKALQLVRFRGYGSGSDSAAAQAGIDHDDYGRMQVQQMFLKALIDQTLTASNIKRIPAIIEIAGKNLRTDMDVGNIAWYGEQLLKVDGANINFSTLPTHSINYSGDAMANGYYEVVESEAALAMINERINPFTFEITDRMVRYIDPEN